MAVDSVEQYRDLIEAVLRSPGDYLKSTYDAEADALYLQFEESTEATDSELTDDDVIVRYRGGDVVGLTILHASKRRAVSSQS